MSRAVLSRAASASNLTGGCAKGHYQRMALCGLEVAGSRALSFPVWAGVLIVLGPPAAIQQKVLECLQGLRGWHGTGGWLQTGWGPKDGEGALGRDPGRVCFELPVWQIGSINTCPAPSHFLPRTKTNIYL